jgi:hypothetical protein
MYPSVTEVAPSEEYRLLISFENGERGILDMQPFLDFGVFRDLKELEVFRQVRVSFDTIEWPGGIDLDPEFVYRNCRMTADQSAGAS